MRSKEEILEECFGDSNFEASYYELQAMDDWGKQEAIGFMKWYGVKMMGFIQYLKEVKLLVTSREMEEKIKEFEGKTFDELYSLYTESKTK